MVVRRTRGKRAGVGGHRIRKIPVVRDRAGDGGRGGKTTGGRTGEWDGQSGWITGRNRHGDPSAALFSGGGDGAKFQPGGGALPCVAALAQPANHQAGGGTRGTTVRARRARGADDGGGRAFPAARGAGAGRAGAGSGGDRRGARAAARAGGARSHPDGGAVLPAGAAA